MPINSSFYQEANIAIRSVTPGAAPSSPSSVIMNKKSRDLQQEVSQDKQLGPPLTSEDIFYAQLNGEAIDTTWMNDNDQCSSIGSNTTSAAATNIPIDTLSSDSNSRLVLDVLTDSLLLEEVQRPISSKSIMKSSRSCASESLDDDPVDQSESYAHDEEGEEEEDMVGALASACWASTSNADPFDATVTTTRSEAANGEDEEDASSSYQANENSIFYQLAHHVRTQYELREKAEKFRSCVDIRDRTYNLTVYKDCFIGSEAVDAMIYGELVTTREEAVALGRQLAKEQNLFKHVRGRHLFKDEHIFYKFRRSNGDESSTFNLGTSSSSSHSVANSSAASNSDDGSISTHDDDATEFATEDSTEFKSVSSSSISNNRRNNNNNNNKGLSKMAALFRECVDVRDRRFRMKTFKQCFVGREVVDTLVNARVVSTRKEAVQFGRTLAKELDLFSHVTGDHAFCDEYLFFRFKDAGMKQDKRVLPITLATL